jgi:hypothetical protein
MTPGRGKACTAELFEKTVEKGPFIEALTQILRPETVQFRKYITQSGNKKWPDSALRACQSKCARSSRQ